MSLKLDFYKNKIQGHKNQGKVYARVNPNKMIGIADLAKHIQKHGSPYTKDVIIGVLSKISECIRELALEGTPVKIDDLCIFRAAVTVKPADDVESFNLTKGGDDGNIKYVRMQCRPTGESMTKPMTASAELGYTSMALKVKTGEAVLSDKKGEYLATSAGGDGWGDEPLNP